MKPISPEAQREPTADELKEAMEVLKYMEHFQTEEQKARWIAYCLREARQPQEGTFR